MISSDKQTKGLPQDLTVDVHPARPDYRGIAVGEKIISLQADPTFEEIESAGAAVGKHDETHTILDDLFLISGEIPRQTPYETGLKGAMRFDRDEGDWFSDERIADERFLMCNIKGARNARQAGVIVRWLTSTRKRNRRVHWLQPCWRGQRCPTCSRPFTWIRAPACCRWWLSSGNERTRPSREHRQRSEEIRPGGSPARTLFRLESQI